MFAARNRSLQLASVARAATGAAAHTWRTLCAPIPSAAAARAMSTEAVVGCSLLSWRAPMCAIEQAFQAMHDATGLPWWATVVVGTVALRSLIFPISAFAIINVERIRAQMEAYRHAHYTLLVHRIARAEPSLHRYEVQRRANRELWGDEDKTRRMLKLPQQWSMRLAIASQMILWISATLALRSLCGLPQWMVQPTSPHPAPGLTTEGPFWAVNLVEADPTLILPAAVFIACVADGSLMLSAVRLPDTPFYRARHFMVLAAATYLANVSFEYPALLPIFWTTNALTSVVHTVIIASPGFRRLTGAGTTKNERAGPLMRILGANRDSQGSK